MNTGSISRRGLLGAFAATMIVAAPASGKPFGFLKGAGDIRRIRMFSGRTGESIDMVYWVEGEYIKEAMAEISRFMRDVRNNQVIGIDPRTIDIAAASHRLMEASAPYNMLSGYRSKETNDAMRRVSRGVAANSLHIQGQAADLRLDGRSVSQIYRAAAACNAGGVGKYSRSNFVHMDCGPLRTWGS
ncbi:MAG: DUF882 domain-containing protein [Phaeovulum sp.]|uniref:YcbK family protein n=1 Tax=Phaeovulum sp. TaxID=2934796 RepID=UPI0027300132|nr:DUF882 domain-containing protein [Phaeovulum sp.]MDP2063461.1 DUF882 domain-containing protein [Phaeovulum sp.]MDP3860369.1 DUF882 domain-containing protein [Phaeovulum sp.]